MQYGVFFINMSCVCIAIMIGVLLFISNRRYNMRDLLFKINLVFYILAAVIDSAYEYILEPEATSITSTWNATYAFHNFVDIFILLMMFCYQLYICVLLDIEKKFYKKYLIFQSIVFVISAIFIFISRFTHFGFYIENGIVHDSIVCPFGVGYLIALFGIGYISLKFKKFFITRIFNTLFFLIVFSASIFIFQEIYFGGIATMLTFLLPIITMFYLLHSFSYDMTTGAISFDFMNELIKNMYESKRKYGYVAMYLDDPRDLIKGNLELRTFFYHFNEKYFRRFFIFHPFKNCFILTYDKSLNNPNLEQLQYDFEKLYDKFNIDYRIMILKDFDYPFESATSFVDFFKMIKKTIKTNTFYYATQEDLDRYEKKETILRHLKEIDETKDLDDERILLYCQPIYDVKTHKFSGGECLIRLNLPNMGIVYPDDFIPIAEEFGYVHTLSLIVLNKTCKTIDELYKQKVDFERLSVNFSFMDFKDDNFEENVLSIISKYNFPAEKLGIEVTESQNDIDFNNVKDTVNHFKNFNINAYLDDFGTGYSNLERIMEIPFYVIKFDKSLLKAYRNNDNNKILIENFSKIFKSLNYKILFEGIENLEDEKLCIDLGFDYLQGYRYSKPVPIEEFKSFLTT